MQPNETFVLNEISDNLERIANELKEIKQEQKKLNRKLSGRGESTDRETIKQYLPPRFIEKLEDQMGSYKSKSAIGWTTSMPQPPEKLDKFMEEGENEPATNLKEFREELFDLLQDIATDPSNAKDFIYHNIN